MVSIKYPASVNSNKDKYAYLYRLQELLRLEHNVKGKKLTKAQWKEYEKEDFDPKSSLISSEICKYRELLKKDSASGAKLSDIVI